MKYLLLILFISLPLFAHAALEERLADPTKEAKAQAIFLQLRCMVCAGESIHDSNADLARDLRQLVRERITAGESDAQILSYIASRYGDAVLMSPPLKYSTYALWFGPLVLLMVGVAGVWIGMRRISSSG